MNNKTLPRQTADIKVKGPARRHCEYHAALFLWKAQHGASPATLHNFLIVGNRNTHATSVSKLHSSNQSLESATTSLFMGLGSTVLLVALPITTEIATLSGQLVRIELGLFRFLGPRDLLSFLSRKTHGESLNKLQTGDLMSWSQWCRSLHMMNYPIRWPD